MYGSFELYLSIFSTPFLDCSFSKSWILYKLTCVTTTSSSLHFKLICEKRSATAAQRDLVRTQAPKQRNLSKVYINLIVLFCFSGRYMSLVLHLYSPLSWWLTETKRSKACEEMSWNGNDSTPRLQDCYALTTDQHKKNHFSGNTSTRWLFVDHVPRINVILEILAFKERGKQGENKPHPQHTCGITIRSYGWWFHCTIAPTFSPNIKVN